MVLEDARILVTGGANGIGRAAAERFASRGSRVAVCDRNGEGAELAAADIAARHGTKTAAFQMDQRDQGQVEAAVGGAVEALGAVDVLIANAGVASVRPFLELEAKEWQLAVDVNLTGTFYVCQTVARHMVKEGEGGSIVVNVSINGSHNGNEISHYCASKAGLGMLVRCMATELGQHDIRVNAVAPGVIETAMTGPLFANDEIARTIARTTPLGRAGTAEEVADAMVFLASDEARFVDGQILNVCGGQSIPAIPAYYPIDYRVRHPGNQSPVAV